MLENLIIELVKFTVKCIEQFNRIIKQLPLIMMTHIYLYSSRLFSFHNTWSLLTHPTLGDISNIIAYLNRFNLLNQDSFNHILQTPRLSHLKSAMKDLKSKGILNKANLAILIKHQSMDEAANVMIYLSSINLLNDATRSKILNCSDGYTIEYTINDLKDAGILTEQIVIDLLESRHSSNLAMTYKCLHQAKLLTEENKAVFRTHPDLDRLDYCIRDLFNLGLLNQDSFNEIMRHHQSADFAKALVLLHQNSLLTLENKEALIEHSYPRALAEVMVLLRERGLLSRVDQTRILRRPNISLFLNALYLLNNHRMLNEANYVLLDRSLSFAINRTPLLVLLEHKRLFNQAVFERITSAEYAFILNREVGLQIWDRIPSSLFNQEVFERLLQAARHQNPITAMFQVVHNILGFEALPPIEIPDVRVVINRAQSTHTASVHQSSSASALKLKEKYGPLDVTKQFGLIQAYLRRLDNSHRNQVAKRAFEQLIQTHHQDSSEVTLQELVALFFVAIHDDSMRAGTLEDGLSQFISALYEIKRGINIERNDPDSIPDSPICPGGAFNKLIEKLKGLHPLADVVILNDEIAGYKLQRVAPLEALEYLKHLASENLHRMIHMLMRLDKEGLECMWDAIQDPIARHFLPEYALIYLNSKGHFNHRFYSLLDVAKDLTISDVEQKMLKAHVMESKSYHGMCSTTLRPLSIFSLYARRHDNPASQHAFDCQYGLIVKP